MPKSTVIKINHLSKIYLLHHEKPTLAENFFYPSQREKFVALDDINLDIKRGEKIGIIGPNGAGKTTLLKVIAGITTPTAGTVKVTGKVVSLINLDAGFHPELTGYENIFLNGLLIGMKTDEIKKKITKIINFAEIGDFIFSPLYTYSQGMQLRLGFSIAAFADPDILILDEGVGVGDENFRHKSMAKIDDFFKKNKTILIVSHWLDYLKKNCRSFLLMDQGKIVATGDNKVVKKYLSGFST